MEKETNYKNVSRRDLPTMPEKYQLAMAYVPFQKYEKIYSPEEALLNGTVFPELANVPIYQNYLERK